MIFHVVRLLGNHGHGSDMGLYAVIPVNEAFQVDHIADLQVLNSLISLGGLVAQEYSMTKV